MNSATHRPLVGDDISNLVSQVENLRSVLVTQAEAGEEQLRDLPLARRQSAENLLHYLVLRSQDLRPLQDTLTCLGLSSLGGVEPRVLATVDAVLHNLYLISGQKPPEDPLPTVYAGLSGTTDQLELNTRSLLGAYPSKRRAHIIVTLGNEAADDYLMVHQLLKNGMNCMRINCAKDDSSVWSRMIKHLRHAEQATGLSCRVLMDLAGPKLRIGGMQTIPAVIKIRPVRAKDGQLVRPARIWLSAEGKALADMPTADASIALDPDWIASAQVGDSVRFKDHRGSSRRWRIREVDALGCWAEAKKTAYLANGTVLKLIQKKSKDGLATTVASLVPKESSSLVRNGDILYMSVSGEPGKPAIQDSNGELLNPGSVSLAIPEIYRDVRLGEPVCFDDGRITGIIEKQKKTRLQIRITHTQNPVEKLEGGRGVNLPDTQLNLPTLTEKDQGDLEFAARHADMIGLSFTNDPEDVRVLRQRLKELGCRDTGVVLKIETKRGFSNLPDILLEALQFNSCGVMIARGDLAVECGFERLSEVQEEIMWVCESAHVPVIWATQVLEGLTKRGHATRAEVTDAARSQAAEAVMLNKGPYLVRAVKMLDDILQRMQGHHHKKHSMMRELKMASAFHLEKNNN